MRLSCDGIPPIDRMTPAHLETAVFALGDFRDAEARLGFMKGVWRTCVGYAGGTSPSPREENAGDHLQAVMVDYAPQTVTYGQLLELLMHWRGGGAPVSIFVRTETERRLARASVERNGIGASSNGPMARVLTFKKFHRAGNTCQKYYLQTTWAARQLYEDLLTLYGDEDALLRSTLAARLNGLLWQPTSSALRGLPEGAELYGLSPQDLQALVQALAS